MFDYFSILQIPAQHDGTHVNNYHISLLSLKGNIYLASCHKLNLERVFSALIESIC